MDGASKARMQRNLVSVIPVLLLGTLCSGTDMCDGAIAALCVVVGQLWGIHVAHEHSFNCDSGTTQQNWISSFIKPPLLFVDITDTGNSTSFDANSNKTTLIQQGQPVGRAVLLVQCTLTWRSTNRLFL